jgi:non-lysosomal glucosylceramidase
MFSRLLRRRYRDFFNPVFDRTGRVYRDCPTFRGFPLGGVGNGGISVFADGDFSEARTNHNWFSAVRDLRGSFFAIRTEGRGGAAAARLLRRTHHAGPEYQVPNVAHTTFKGEVPFFTLDFTDDDLPVQTSLTGFSPLIPHNVKDSALPVAFFDLVVTNPTDSPLDVSALFSWQNVLGVTGTGGSPLIWRHTFRRDYREHTYAIDPGSGLAGVKFMIRKDFAPNDTRRRAVGEGLILTVPAQGHEATTCLFWDGDKSVPALWDGFVREGRISTPAGYDHRRPGSSKKKCAAVCVKTEIGPGETATFPFILAWFNPYYVLEKNARINILTGRHDGIDHGIYAQNFFSSVEEIGRYAVAEKQRLKDGSLTLHRILKDPSVTDLPADYIDIILNSADSIITNSVLTRRGELLTIEGMDWQLLRPLNNYALWPFGGLTGTNDQRLSSHPYTATFFPTLDRSELETFLDLTEAGKVPHGNGGAEIALKDADTPYAQPIPRINNDKSDWPDLTCSEILQLGKLIRTTGDLALLYRSWPRLVEMSDYLLTLVVDDIPEGSSTYDVFVYEPCFLYHATLYVAALEMLARLSAHVPEEIDPDAADRGREFSRRAARARETYERKLWLPDRGHFRASETNDNLFQGGLAGDWVARLAGISPVVDPVRARSHGLLQDRLLVKAAAATGRMRTVFGGRPLPFNEATHEGKEVPLNFFGVRKVYGANYIYQAISYEAFESIYLGNVAEGLSLIDMVYDKVYEEGYPWDMNLEGMPGYVYMTHPVMWAFFNAITGAALDLLTGTIYLAPQTLPGKDRISVPVFFPHFWLGVTYNARERAGSISVVKAFKGAIYIEKKPACFVNDTIVLKHLVLTLPDGSTGEVSTGDLSVKEGAVWSFSGTDVGGSR